MNYTKQDVIDFIKEDDVKFVKLTFCDVFGKLKNVSILSSEIERAFSSGIAIDASAIKGFLDESRSDLFLHPDPSTIAILPWRPENGKVVRMYSTISYPDGTPFECDSRTILQNAVEYAKNKGVEFKFGAEMEFYLFKFDENGNKTLIPYDNAGYMDVAPEDKGENVRREICLTLEQMGILPESSHHEEGPGQNEIDFKYASPIECADNACTFKSVVNAISNRNGIYASFEPKPLKDCAGSGFHINFSVKGSNENLLEHSIAGILKHIKEITLFLNPTENSYERLGYNKAPNYISWGYGNRSQLIRIPSADGEFKRAELRSPDCSTNPYIAFALIIYASLEGIDEKIEICSPSAINFYMASEEVKKSYEKLPCNIENAIKLAKDSEFIKKYLPEKLLNDYFNK